MGWNYATTSRKSTIGYLSSYEGRSSSYNMAQSMTKSAFTIDTKIGNCGMF